MANYLGRDYVYLIWKDPKSRRQYVVGKLSKNGKYEFEYTNDIEEALSKGFMPLIAFNDVKEKYISDKLFTSFSSRVPDRRRKDINKILDKYNLKEYDEYKLLKRSGGRLPIDDLAFIDPIIGLDENPIERIFNIAGTRYYLGCSGEDCCKTIDIKVKEKLILEIEPNNHKDANAIKIKNVAGELIGYIPRYYSKELTELLSDGWDYQLEVNEINMDNNCNECIKVFLSVYYSK